MKRFIVALVCLLAVGCIQTKPADSANGPDLAAELAKRDQRIASLEKALAEQQKPAAATPFLSTGVPVGYWYPRILPIRPGDEVRKIVLPSGTLITEELTKNDACEVKSAKQINFVNDDADFCYELSGPVDILPCDGHHFSWAVVKDGTLPLKTVPIIKRSPAEGDYVTAKYQLLLKNGAKGKSIEFQIRKIDCLRGDDTQLVVGHAVRTIGPLPDPWGRTWTFTASQIAFSK